MSFVSEYYPDEPASRIQAVDKLWESVKLLEPEVVEGLSYGLPALKLHGRPFIGFGITKKYMSLYPYSPRIISALKDELSGLETSAGTIRFYEEGVISEELLGIIVEMRRGELL